jgi:hypothetical protein
MVVHLPADGRRAENCICRTARFTFAPECACGDVLIVTARHPIEHGCRLLGPMRRNHIANRVLLVGGGARSVPRQGFSSLGELVGHVVVRQAGG